MRRSRLLLLALACLFAGCQTHVHTIGAGPTGLGSESARQFYIFFGLFQIGEADSQRLAHDASGYEIVTSYSFVDILLQPILLPLTITSRTMTVNR